MSKTLEEIRKKLQALQGTSGGNRANADKTTYPHWNIAEGTSSIVRFLPDANQDNTFFWAERQLIKLTFPGILGQDQNKEVTVQVPCVEMWDGANSCPILNEVRPMWKDPSLEATARKYWKKRTFYFQGFVKQDALNEQDPPENPIRKFIVGPQIFAIIKAALLDPDMENTPVDYINGTDFVFSKTSKGGFADYSTSKWARKESSLTDEQLAAIEQYGLVDLSTYLPKKPSPEHLSAMFEMFEASINGEYYDPAKWSQFYKPYGFDSADSSDEFDEDSARKPAARSASRPAPTPAAKPVAQQPVVESAPVDDVATEPVSAANSTPVTASTEAKKSPQEILAMLRNRNKS